MGMRLLNIWIGCLWVVWAMLVVLFAANQAGYISELQQAERGGVPARSASEGLPQEAR